MQVKGLTLRFPLMLCLLIGLWAAGCGSDDGEDAMGAGADRVEGEATLTVMTYNVYLGGDLEAAFQRLLGTQFDEVPRIAYGIYDEVVNQSDFVSRAEGIAASIAESEPHFVGLQEMALIRVGAPDFLVNPLPNAETVVLDFRQALEAALERQGLDYVFAHEVRNIDVELPMLDDSGTLLDARLTLFDVLLVRDDVVVAGENTGNYAAAAEPIPELPITLRRGYVTVDASVAGRAYRVVNTHLEAAFPDVRNAQAAELIAYLDTNETPAPTILLGDFNSSPDVQPGAGINDSGAYAAITGGDFVDMWKGGAGTGYTCCQDPGLASEGNLSKRIDFIFVRNAPAPGAAAIDTDVDGAFTVGDLAADRVATDDGLLLWPSDHAGVGAELRVE